MRITKIINKLSIKKQLIFLVLAPLVLITFLSTTNNIYQTINATNAEIGYIGSHAAKTAASLAELNMFAGNINELNSLGRATVSADHIEAIAFLQPDKKPLSLTSKNQTTINFNTKLSGTSKPIKEKNLWYFSEPITLTGIEFNDFNTISAADATTTDQLIGWVVIIVNEDELIQRLWSTILMNITINGVAALIAGLLAWLLANEITISLANIIHTVKKLIKGHFNTRVVEKSGGEMGALEHGINELAYQAGKSQQTLTQDINKATQKLQTAMLKLETHNTELTIAKEEAEIANQAKDMFLARMSHELRTPLATVLGFSKLLRTTQQNKEQAEHTNVIMQASTLLLSIIDDILEFSKLQSSTITLEHIDFDLESCLDEVIALHSLSVHKKNIALVLLIESDVPLKLTADKLRIQQMVSNLVSNAIKFTTQGHVVVIVSVITEQDEYVNLKISVIDSGEGISNHNMNKLFKPFAQADTSISRRHGGTGLGLVIVKSFAELMDGTIHLESQLSKGTEAILSIKCNKQPPALTNTPLVKIMLNTIIIYDQNAWVRRFFRDRLRGYCDNIFVVANTAVLNSLLLQHAGCCKLLIIGLSTQECATNQSEIFLSNIRQVYSGPIILTAGHPLSDKILSNELRQQLQPITYLSKPISGHNLYSAIKDCVTLEPQMVIKAWDNKNTATYEVLPFALKNSLKWLDILVVEDNELNLQLIRTILETEGACTWPALNGVKAIDSCATKTFDIILMDVHLPLIDGIEASKQIRKNTPNANTPIIALTANVVDTEEQALLEAGVFCICYKPIDEHNLIKSILRAVKREDSFLAPEDEPIITISKEQLAKEIYKQIAAIEDALRNYEWVLIKDISHQLLGLTGLSLFQQASQIIKIIDNAVQENNESIVKEQLLLLKSIINKNDLLNLDKI